MRRRNIGLLMLAWTVGFFVFLGLVAMGTDAARQNDWNLAGKEVGAKYAGVFWLGLIALAIWWFVARPKAPAPGIPVCPRCGLPVQVYWPSCPRCGFVPAPVGYQPPVQPMPIYAQPPQQWPPQQWPGQQAPQQQWPPAQPPAPPEQGPS